MVKAALPTLVVGVIDQAESCALREVACGIRPSHSGHGDSQGAACKQRGQSGDRPTKGRTSRGAVPHTIMGRALFRCP